MVASVSINRQSPSGSIKSQQGFSLLEILVAFIIMGAVVGALLQLFSSSMRSVLLSDEYSYAAQVAESALTRLGIEIPIEANITQGRDINDNYRWSVEVKPYDFEFPEEAPPATFFPYRVAVKVDWQSGHQQRQFSLTSLRFGKAP